MVSWRVYFNTAKLNTNSILCVLLPFPALFYACTFLHKHLQLNRMGLCNTILSSRLRKGSMWPNVPCQVYFHHYIYLTILALCSTTAKKTSSNVIKNTSSIFMQIWSHNKVQHMWMKSQAALLFLLAVFPEEEDPRLLLPVRLKKPGLWLTAKSDWKEAIVALLHTFF